MMQLRGWILIWRAGLRPLILLPRNALLSVTSIALGVAVFLSVTIANRAAVESFKSAFSQITGKADLELRGAIPEEIVPSVEACEGVEAATPVIEAMVTMPDFPGESLRIAGIDPFTAEGVLGIQPDLGNGQEGGMAAWLGSEPVMAVGEEFLTRRHLQQGERVRLQGPGAPRRVTLEFAFSKQTGMTDGHVAAMDIAAAQEWLGTPGKVTEILIKLKDSATKDSVVARLRKLVPATVTIAPPSQHSKQVEIMLASFRMNLSALSLVSLMVGMFFVGNAAAAAVIRNRVSLGILRAVGVGGDMILFMVLLEAALCGLAGSLLGIIVSPMLAGLLSAPLTQTVTALYLPVESQGGWPSLAESGVAVCAGVGAALLAAWIPARGAAGVDPTQVLHPGTAPEIFPIPVRRLAGVGLLILACAVLLSMAALHGGPALLGFGSAFLVLTGFSLFVPGILVLLIPLLTRGPVRSQPVIRVALEQALRSLHRVAPTVAALAAAVSMMVGISVMIHSFRGSVIDWTNRTLTSDLFIAPAANELLGLTHTLPEGVVAWWKAQPHIKDVGTYREFEVRSGRGEQVTLGVVSGAARGTIDFLHGKVEEKTQKLLSGKGVALSESLAQRLHLGEGDQLVLVTPKGERSFPVLDLYRDYTRDRGIAMMGADLLRELWGDCGIHSLAIAFNPGTTQQEMDQQREKFMRHFGGEEAFVCYSNGSLKRRIVEIFNQTFAITAVLRTISIVVAIGGVMLTLGMLVMERARDNGVLRAMGASSAQMVKMMVAEAALIGAVASVVGLVSGASLALVLTWVINKAFFGWSINLAFPWLELWMVPLWMTCASVVAGVIPAIKAAAVPPATALRME